MDTLRTGVTVAAARPDITVKAGAPAVPVLELDRITLCLSPAPGRPPAPVLDGISGTLAPGVTLLLGPNGAGKTTLLRVLAGLRRPDGGAVRWQGRRLESDLAGYRRRLGYLPQRPATYPEMTVTDFLDYIAALKAIPPALAAPRRDELLAALGLDGAARSPLRRLPHGHLRLVGLAQALLNDPDVLLLDEPLEGLDPENCHRALSLLRRAGRVTVMATHRTERPVPGTVAIWQLAAGRLTVTALNAAAPDVVESR